jgi:hypothetical protein
VPGKKTGRGGRQAKAPSSQAGEYVREEIEHFRQGKHGARSAKQAIAIGLSKARRAGVKLPPPPGGKAPKAVRSKPNPNRSRAVRRALEREGRAAGSHRALSRQAHSSTRRRGPAARKAAARKAVSTNGVAGRRAAAGKAAPVRRRP